MSDPEVVDILVRLVRMFDVILIQEVVDVSGKAVQSLLQAVNRGADDYDVLVSDRVGRSSQKEQYAVFYKTLKVKILESQVYNDTDDVFVREPLIVKMRCETIVAPVQDLTLICIHTQPKSANQEIDRLFDVHKYVTGTLAAENVIILGDFNAGGSYIKSQDWDSNRLRQDGFSWLIPDHVDTTATNTLAAYDRIVVWGENLIRSVTPGSPSAFRYDELFNIQQETVLKVSDHYPVCFTLKTSVHPTLEKYISRRVGFIFEDRRLPNIQPQVLLEEFKLAKFKVRGLHDSSGGLQRVEVRSNKLGKLADVVSSLEKLRNGNKDLVSYSLMAALKHELEHVEAVDPSLVEEEKGKYTIILTLDLELKSFSCSVEISTNLH